MPKHLLALRFFFFFLARFLLGVCRLLCSNLHGAVSFIAIVMIGRPLNGATAAALSCEIYNRTICWHRNTSDRRRIKTHRT